MTEVEIPVTLNRDGRGVESRGGGHDEDKEGIEKEERSVVAIKYPRRRSVHLEPVIRKEQNSEEQSLSAHRIRRRRVKVKYVQRFAIQKILAKLN